jgi:hypothetical protein
VVSSGVAGRRYIPQGQFATNSGGRGKMNGMLTGDRSPAMAQLIPRRTLLLSPVALAANAQQNVGPPPHSKGPKVFLDYDQVELDVMYNQASYAPNAAQVQLRYASNSDLARARLGTAEWAASALACPPPSKAVSAFSEKRTVTRIVAERR